MAEAELLLAIEPGGRVRRSHGHRASARATIGAGTIDRPVLHDRPERAHRPSAARSARRPSSTAGPRSATTRRSSRWRRSACAPQDLKYKGEPTRLVIGTRNIFREFVDDPPRHGRRRRRDDDRRRQPVHGLRARRARLPRRQRHDLRAARHARRPRQRSRITSNISAGSAVHQFCRVGAARVHRRLLGGHQGRAAVSRARSATGRRGSTASTSIGLTRRGFTRRDASTSCGGRTATCCSRSSTRRRALDADRADPTLPSPEVAYLVDFIRTSQRGVILRRPTRQARTRAGRPSRMKLGPDRGNGRFPFLVLDAARAHGARRHDRRRSKEEAFPELEAAARASARRADPLDLARPARHLHQDAEGRRRQPRGDGRAGQARQDLRRRHRAGPDAALAC